METFLLLSKKHESKQSMERHLVGCDATIRVSFSFSLFDYSCTARIEMWGKETRVWEEHGRWWERNERQLKGKNKRPGAREIESSRKTEVKQWYREVKQVGERGRNTSRESCWNCILEEIIYLSASVWWDLSQSLSPTPVESWWHFLQQLSVCERDVPDSP